MGRHDRRRARRLSFSSQTSYVPEEGGLRIGTRWWIRLPTGGAGGSTITPQQVSDDGTLRVSARIEPPSWQTGGAVDIVATLRCPGWGDVALSGAVAGPLDGVSRCPAPYEVRSSRLAGQAVGTITFAGLAGPTVDTAVLRTGSVGWGGRPTARASRRRSRRRSTTRACCTRPRRSGAGRAGPIAEATIRCP